MEISKMMFASKKRKEATVVRVILGGQDWEHMFLHDTLFQDLDEVAIFTHPKSNQKYEIVFVAMNYKAGDFKISALIPPVGHYYEVTSPKEISELFQHITWKNSRQPGHFEDVFNFHDSAVIAARKGGLNQHFGIQFLQVCSSPQVPFCFLFFNVTIFRFMFFHLTL